LWGRPCASWGRPRATALTGSEALVAGGAKEWVKEWPRTGRTAPTLVGGRAVELVGRRDD
jgi:hypothetical protein